MVRRAVADTPEHIWWRWYEIPPGDMWMLKCTAHTYDHVGELATADAMNLPLYEESTNG